MTKIILALQSRTFWTIVVMFLVGGINGVSNLIPSGLETPIMGILALLATYFKVSPSQDYNPPASA